MSYTNQQHRKAGESLVDLARRGKLSEFQYMDDATCRWIAQNNPGGKVSVLPYTSSYLPLLRKLSVLPQWFLEARMIDSLHGLRHLWRTAYFGLYLAREADLDRSEVKLAVIACLLHDIRRRNDKGDEGHASLSAAWFGAHAERIIQHWGIDLNHDEIGSIKAAIALHETPYEDFSPAQRVSYKEKKVLVDIVKTADALDRYRLPKLKWWINDSHLALAPSSPLKQLAFEIVLASERNFLKQGDSYESVRRAVETVEDAHIHLSSAWASAHQSYNSSAVSEELA